MRNKILYILIIGLLSCLLVSCSTIIDDESVAAQDSIGVNFTLSMNGVDNNVSRSSSVINSVNYENNIDPTLFRVLANTSDGNVREVFISSIIKNPTLENVYNISGRLNSNYSIEKIVVLANCDKSFNPTTSSLRDLTYNYNYADFNPLVSARYIPMWGEKRLNVTLKPGTSTDIGTISLMRAMAKISIKLIGEEDLTQVTMGRCNNIGRSVPDVANLNESFTEAIIPTIPVGATKSQSVVFFKINNKEAFIYLPEQNKSDKLRMIVTVGAKNYDLDFREYNNNLSFFDVLRNYHYHYDVSVKKVDEKISFNVKYNVVDWGTETVDIEFN